MLRVPRVVKALELLCCKNEIKFFFSHYAVLWTKANNFGLVCEGCGGSERVEMDRREMTTQASNLRRFRFPSQGKKLLRLPKPVKNTSRCVRAVIVFTDTVALDWPGDWGLRFGGIFSVLLFLREEVLVSRGERERENKWVAGRLLDPLWQSGEEFFSISISFHRSFIHIQNTFSTHVLHTEKQFSV